MTEPDPQPAPERPANAIDVEGGWIVTRDPETVPERDYRLIDAEWQEMTVHDRRLLAAPDKPTGEDQVRPRELISKEAAATLFRIADLAAAMLITEWSFDLAISAEGLAMLPRKTYRSVQEATAADGARMLPDFSDVNGDPTGP